MDERSSHSKLPLPKIEAKKSPAMCRAFLNKLEDLFLSPRTFNVGVTDDFSVRNRRNNGTNLDRGALRFNSSLGSSRLFTPYQDNFSTDLNVCINSTERQTAALVVAVAREHRQTNHIVATHDGIE